MGVKIGWVVSGVVIVVVIVVVWILMTEGNGLDDPTPATTAIGKLSLIPVDTDFSALVQIPEGGEGAEKVYAEMVAGMMQANNPSHFLNLVKHSQDTATDFKAIFDDLEKASDMGISKEPLVFPAMPINPKTTFAAWDGLYGIGEVAGKAAMNFRADKKQAEAERCCGRS